MGSHGKQPGRHGLGRVTAPKGGRDTHVTHVPSVPNPEHIHGTAHLQQLLPGSLAKEEGWIQPGFLHTAL